MNKSETKGSKVLNNASIKNNIHKNETKYKPQKLIFLFFCPEKGNNQKGFFLITIKQYSVQSIKIQ